MSKNPNLNATVISDETAMEHASESQNITGRVCIDHDYIKLHSENNNFLKYVTNIDTSDPIYNENETNSFSTKDHEISDHAKENTLENTLTEENTSNKQKYLKKVENSHSNEQKLDLKKEQKKNCEFCFKEFDNMADLLMHVSDKHLDIKPEMFQCNNCPLHFINENDMENHMHDDHDDSSRADENQIKNGWDLNYRNCFVPGCLSTSIKLPGKIFIAVPFSPEKREKWFKAAKRRDLCLFGPNSKFYCCEDHFDLQNDSVNWLIYKRIKDDVAPHIFPKTAEGNTSPGKRKSVEDGPEAMIQQIPLKNLKKKAIEFGTLQLNSILTRPVISVSDLVDMTDDQLDIHITSEEEPDDGDWCIINEDINEHNQGNIDSEVKGAKHTSNESEDSLKCEYNSIKIEDDCALKKENHKLDQSIVTKNETVDVCNRFKDVNKERGLSLHDKENNLDNSDSDRVFKCRDCSSSFLNEEDISQHIRVWHGTKNQFKSSMTQDSLKRINELVRVETKNINLIIDTDVFEKFENFQRDNSFKPDLVKKIPKNVKIQSSAKKRQTCTICRKDYANNHFKSHMKEVHSENEFICNICGMKFKCERYLKRHTLYKHENGIKPHEKNSRCLCPECPKTFKNSDCLSHHVRNCHGNKVECELCHSKLKSIAYLKSHMRRVHYNDGKTHKCKICYKTFKSPRQVKIHMINIHPETLYPCPNCVRLFCNAVQLKIHLKKCKTRNEPDDLVIERDVNIENDEDLAKYTKIDDSVDLTVD